MLFYRKSSPLEYLPWILIIALIACVLLVEPLLHKSLQKTDPVVQDAYTYLTMLSPELVLQGQTEGSQISPDTWMDLLSIRSTLGQESANILCAEIISGKSFAQVIAGQSTDRCKATAYRRSILSKYPLFSPGTYQFPVEGCPWYIDTFGADREGGKRNHEGTDLFSKEGTPIYNVVSGKIEQLGWNRLGGERVGVRGQDGNYYYYAHLTKINPALQIGQTIPQNTWLGLMGHTGDALTTPDHLHFGIELPNGQWINPYTFLVVWQYNRGLYKSS